MHGPTCIFRANLTPLSLQVLDHRVRDNKHHEYQVRWTSTVDPTCPVRPPPFLGFGRISVSAKEALALFTNLVYSK
jgi:hypothetical protein